MGFKSFADKLEIKFDKGVTCIVGPNGCGKSNVADAIRWVLGEQSAKSLRGGNMQDVIFNGTQMRKSLSYCEVSLIFDNTEKLFDIEYNEVIFTRKLYRSGESEYLINRQNCRLKDIVRLLHGVGIGKDGYSIIGQNKISEIMNSKPDERRSIFEEATGIAVFKAKKAEIERKLANSTENLERYFDIMTEVEHQLAPLSKQAENARQYFNFAEQLKSHEINTYLFKYDNAAAVKNKINLKLAGITDEIEDKKSELLKTQKNYENGFSKQQNMDNELYDMQEKLRDKEVSLEKQQGQSKVYFERISALNSDIFRNEDEVKNGKLRIEQIEAEKTQKNAKIVEINAENIKIADELIKINSELNEVSEQVAIFERAAELSQERMINSIENLAEIKSNATSLTAEKDVISERQNEIIQKMTDLNNKREIIAKEIENLNQELEQLLQEQQDYKQKITDCNDSIYAINQEIHDIENKIYSENSRNATLEANQRMLIGLKESFEGYNYSVKRLMTASKDDNQLSLKIKGVIADIIKTEQKYETAIETAIGGAMQNVVTANPDDARFLIEYLKRTRGGTVTFLPVSSVRPRYEQNQIKNALSENGVIGLANEIVKFNSYYENIVRFLLGNTLICDNIANAVNISKKYLNAFKIVTLEGDIINPSGSMTGGYKKQEAASLLSNDRKISQVEIDLKTSNDQLVKLKAEKSNKEQLKQNTIKRLEDYTNFYHSSMQKAVAVNAKIDSNKLIDIDLLNELTNYGKSSDIIKTRLNKLMNKFNSTFEGTEKAQKLKSDVTSEMEKNKTDYENLKSRQKTLSEKSSKYHLDINTYNITKQNFTADIERITKEKEELLQKIKQLVYENEGKQFSINELKLAAEKVSLSPEELDEINSARMRIKNISEEKKELNNTLTELDNQKTALTEQISKLNEKKYSDELALSKVDSELDMMRERIWEEYQATYEGSQNLRIEEYNAAQGKTEISKLKKQITDLGSINYNAIEDYNALNLRHEEMLIQKEDMDKAHKDLSTVLLELRGEMQKQFDEGFVKINENFKKTFKELFGGGKAELQMDYTDCLDPLMAGVEIVAEPPGKKLQKISLLSGGEQALTAIAILFAILKLRAMPFCVLDEIEAALDEANVERFAKYLKNFSLETQFIVITHRKPTMELADSLYGVTMEEKGVSRMVSVKLSDIENQLDIA
jgi:chromosome segregation protein